MTVSTIPRSSYRRTHALIVLQDVFPSCLHHLLCDRLASSYPTTCACRTYAELHGHRSSVLGAIAPPPLMRARDRTRPRYRASFCQAAALPPPSTGFLAAIFLLLLLNYLQCRRTRVLYVLIFRWHSVVSRPCRKVRAPLLRGLQSECLSHKQTVRSSAAYIILICRLLVACKLSLRPHKTH